MAKGNNTTMKKALIALNVLVILGLGGASAYLFLENKDLNDQLTLTTEEKNRRLVEEINDVYDLPDEEPVVAVVTDPEQFKSEYPVFENAESGDYLLFFRKARLNVLYRQDEKRVVKTADVAVPVSVEIIGSESALSEIEKKLADFGDQISVTKTVKDGVTQSFVLDLDEDQGAETKSISDLLGLDIGTTLTAGIEPNSQTEIVIVVAGDKTSAPAAEAEPTSE